MKQFDLACKLVQCYYEEDEVILENGEYEGENLFFIIIDDTPFCGLDEPSEVYMDRGVYAFDEYGEYYKEFSYEKNNETLIVTAFVRAAFVAVQDGVTLET